MRTEPPALLPLLRSQVHGNLFALTYLSPTQKHTVTEAAHRIGASVRATQREVDRLTVTYGPLPLVTEELRAVPGIAGKSNSAW